MAIAEVPMPPDPSSVIKQVANDHQITITQLLAGRARKVTIARADACRRLYELRTASGHRCLSMPDVARLLWLRNHTSVWHWVSGEGKDRYR